MHLRDQKIWEKMTAGQNTKKIQQNKNEKNIMHQELIKMKDQKDKKNTKTMQWLLKLNTA